MVIKGCKRLTLLLTSIAVIFVYLTWSNGRLSAPVLQATLDQGEETVHESTKKETELMDCQVRTRFLNSIAPSEKNFSNIPSHCEIRRIIQTLYSSNTGMKEFQQSVLSLGECQDVYYPRVPKCASRTTLNVFRKLAKKHWFSSDTYDIPVLDFASPEIEHEYITNITKKAKSVLYSRQTHYINFTRHHAPLPVQITVIRDPIDRLTSAYYFRIYGSSQNKNKNKPLALDCRNVTLDDTVAEMGASLTADINLSGLHRCWPRAPSQAAFFCDCLADCQTSSEHRLKQAIRALENDFLLVGLTEHLPEFMEALELLLPHVFRKATTQFDSEGEKMKDMTQTKTKSALSANTHARLRDLLADDYTLYYAAQKRFFTILEKLRNLQFDPNSVTGFPR